LTAWRLVGAQVERPHEGHSTYMAIFMSWALNMFGLN